MKTFSITLLLLFLSYAGSARLITNWSYQEMQEKADLVVIAKPLSTVDTQESGKLPNGPTWDVIGLSTEFAIHTVLKGDNNMSKFVLHHYRLTNPEQVLVDGPNFVSFDKSSRYCFLLFLKKESDGRYAPISGQMDPALYSVLELKGYAR